MNFHKTLTKQSGCIPHYHSLNIFTQNVPTLRNNHALESTDNEL